MGNIYSFLGKKYPMSLNDYFKVAKEEKTGSRHIYTLKSSKYQYYRNRNLHI